MKKYILLCFLCFGINELCHSQFYLKGYTGYALSTGNEKLTSLETINNEKYESAYRWKFGQGVNLGLSMGYALNKNIAFELTGNTQLFSRFNYSKSYQWDFTYEPGGNFSWYAEGFFGDLEYANTMYQVSPQIVFMSNPYNQWTFYLKGGPDFIRVTHKRTTQSLPTDLPSFFEDGIRHTPSNLYTTEYSGDMNTGIQCSLGTEYKLSKNISAFVELTTVNVKYTFKKSNILRYEIDGVDSLSELASTSSEQEKKFSFNHVGLNVGLKYIFR